MKKILYLSTLIMIFFSSCLNVFQPLITPEKYLNDPKVEGSWTAGNQVINITEYAKSPLSKEELFIGNSNEKKSDRAVIDSIRQYHRTYILSFSDKVYTYYYQMHMGKFNSGYYVQLLPVLYIKGGDTKEINDEMVPDSRFNAFGEGVVSTYAFAKINFTSSRQMDMQFIDGEKIKQLILTGQFKAPYAFDKLYNNFLITADSDALEKMVNKYGSHDEFYNKEKSFSLNKAN